MHGTLALVGGREFTDGCTFDRELFSDVGSVLVIPSALAYENPDEAVERARGWFASMGVSVDHLDVFRRAEAMEVAVAERAASAEAVYLTGGSPQHLRSVLKDTPLLDSLLGAWRAGAVIAAGGESASVLCSHMVDSRGGAYTVGLDLITTMTVIPRYNQWSPEKWHRTVELARKGLPVVGIEEATALIRSPEGEWRVEGSGTVHVFVDGARRDLEALPRALNPLLSI
jgi:cyanophycinase